MLAEGVLRQTIASLIQNNRSYANFIWHGGEPLLMGVDFFRRIVELQGELNDRCITINNSVQTNGILLNDEWIDFFIRNDFHIGISLDGFHDLHSLNRGVAVAAFDSIMLNINKLTKARANFGVLSVVTQNSLGNEEQIFDFFDNACINSVGFLPMNYGDSQDSLSAKDYGVFLERYFDLWLEKGKLGLSIREFDEYLRGYCEAEQMLCSHSNTCDSYFTVTPTGDLFPCDCFPQTTETRLGTIFGDLGVAYSNQKAFLAGSERLPQDCVACEYGSICKGGCKFHRWVNSKDFSKNQFYCETYKSLYKKIEASLKTPMP